jgi:hypothetical protein
MAAEVNHAHTAKTRKLPASSFRFSVTLVAVNTVIDYGAAN